MSERKYLPTFADLVDRLSIVMLKSVYIPENRQAYLQEMQLIEHDLGLMCNGTELRVRAILAIMLANHFIWLNESKARAGGSEQNDMLRATHSVNGLRNTAKNVLSQSIGERIDLKVDCLAADLPAEFGCWQLFENVK